MTGMMDPKQLACIQVEAWKGARLSFSETSAGLRAHLNAIDNANINTFLYELEGKEVRLYPSNYVAALQEAGKQMEVVRRANTYVRLFRDALEAKPLEHPLTLAVNMGDLAQPVCGLPVFSFQKEVGSQVIALPDHEMIERNYLEDVDIDKITYRTKMNAAFFSGSTTGVANYTLEDLQLQRVPRVRAARFFKSHKSVDFFLPNVCQFDSEIVRDLLLSEGFGDGIPISLLEGYKYKFGILMDGNGATCSRTAIILRSQSVLIKYVSPYELYYTSALRPGEHFLPAYNDFDVLHAVESETQDPGRYELIGESGRILAEKLLTRAAILEYTSDLLEQYSRIFRDFA